jgi:hypothetical protein
MYTDLEKKTWKIHPGSMMFDTNKFWRLCRELGHLNEIQQCVSSQIWATFTPSFFPYTASSPPLIYAHSPTENSTRDKSATIQLGISAANGKWRYAWGWIDRVGQHVQCHKEKTADCSPEEQEVSPLNAPTYMERLVGTIKWSVQLSDPR